MHPNKKFGKVKGSETKIHEENAFECRNCDYTTTSRHGLKIHNSKDHSKINSKEFPAACDICEKVFENETNLKKLEHTYHNVKYQCNDCEYMANGSPYR